MKKKDFILVMALGLMLVLLSFSWLWAQPVVTSEPVAISDTESIRVIDVNNLELIKIVKTNYRKRDLLRQKQRLQEDVAALQAEIDRIDAMLSVLERR